MKILLADFRRFIGKRSQISERLPRMAAALSDMGCEVVCVLADEKKKGEPAFVLPKTVSLYNLYYVKGEMVVRPSVLLKALKLCLSPLSKAAARDQDYRMVRAAKTPLLRILKDEAPDVVISFHETTSRLLLAGIDADVPVVTWLSENPEMLFADAPYYERHDIEKSACILADTEEAAARAKDYLKCERFAALPAIGEDGARDIWKGFLEDVSQKYQEELARRGPKPAETPFSFFRNNW